MTIMTRRLNDNSALILSACGPMLANLNNKEDQQKAPSSHVDAAYLGLLRAKAACLSYLRVAECSWDGIKHQLTPLWGRMKVGTRNKNPNKKMQLIPSCQQWILKTTHRQAGHV
jgi:hypothetical protein